ncbi:DNA polymerase III, epsilon subunit [Neorickettsia helminthoeca str. Oregon]|uniref:DNA polymerase III subunit epsilon n=1 Tax=Neorickettsia helminthoeca str. Oregon TaxID=1286528 RepID=X5H3W5_9RICK|nr:DNA polymerase III subunit epsilon [Neorickettsia helminthoeca]AHX11388.1 DNA polymerase III, epsilon subunit [Neorickettsia helminthoeca str. Oregon]
MTRNRKIVLDTETTGLDIKNGDRVIEIGCVEVIDSFLTGNVFHVYLNPEREISKEATRVHGITLDQLQDSPKFNEIADEFIAFIGSASVVAHNASFDVRFLNSELMRARCRTIIKPENVIDTLAIARKMFPGSPASLDALCRRFRISLEQRTTHGALLDAQLLARVYIELSKGNQGNISFVKELSDSASTSVTLEARKFLNTHEEMLGHAELIKRIKNPIWDEILSEDTEYL